MSEDALRRLARTLVAATTTEQLLADVADLLVPELADWCVADLLQPPDLVTRVAAVGPDGPLALPPDLGPVNARRSSAQAVGLLPRLLEAPGQRLLLGVEDLQALSASPDERAGRQARLALSLGTTELLLLGVAGRGQLLATLGIGRSRRPFTPGDISVLSASSALTGLALDGVRLLALQRGVSTALQRSLLPQLPVVPGTTLAARFVPAGSGLAVGGDWYDAFTLPGGPLALVVGDATGHDVQAATRMAELRNLLRALAVDREDTPAATLSRLDRVAASLAPELSGTCVYAQLDAEAGGSRRLTWSSAGHLAPVLLRDGRARLLETDPDLMLGVREDPSRADHVERLEVGDVLVLYTDGLVEDRQEGLDARLDVLTRLVVTAGREGPEHLADALVGQLPVGDDDVAVLVARVDPPPRQGAG